MLGNRLVHQPKETLLFVLQHLLPLHRLSTQGTRQLPKSQARLTRRVRPQLGLAMAAGNKAHAAIVDGGVTDSQPTRGSRVFSCEGWPVRHVLQQQPLFPVPRFKWKAMPLPLATQDATLRPKVPAMQRCSVRMFLSFLKCWHFVFNFSCRF